MGKTLNFRMPFFSYFIVHDFENVKKMWDEISTNKNNLIKN
jgi:hypothetical protein